MSNKRVLHETFDRLLTEITPEKLLSEQCRLDGHFFSVGKESYDLSKYQKVYLLGSGKAVIPMAKAMQKILQPLIENTVIVGPYPEDTALEKTAYIKSSHPLPTQQSIEAASLMIQTLEEIGEEDLFIYLLSGGSSALLELPESEISLGEFQEVTSLMLHGGMPIESMNAVRKHLSRIKGGKLGTYSNADGIVLVLSDVADDDLHAIGSAPLYCDTTTFRDAVSALEAYRLFDRIPKSVQKFLIEGAEGKHPETPKNPHPHIEHYVIGSNRIVLEKAKKLLEHSGIKTTIMRDPVRIDACEFARELTAFAQRHRDRRHCYLFGGEPTVTVTGDGRGGRNQHLCLSLLSLMDAETDIALLSAATDGVDGNSDAAGAVIDIHSPHNAQLHHVDPMTYLEAFDSNTFFEKTGELIKTGPTHNNLLDIVMLLIEPTLQQGETYG
ncbi:MAG TPA: DUF4147 domain-containing protein [Epsilonproteobacteria bacterium]|nr:DUF4147 domain-containing protein [Campylobacterota bacterium]